MVQGLLRVLLAMPLVAGFGAAGHAAAIERGVAITDPQVLHELNSAKLSLARMLGADASSSAANLFGLPSMTAVRDATDRDFNRYVIDHKDAPDRLRLFDRDALNAPRTLFDLVGVVNRVDRAYVSPDDCGEIRLIYRPIANHDSTSKDDPPLRLPMTFNLVMKAKPAGAGLTCAEIAKRWLALSDAPPAAGHAAALTANGGALEWIVPEAIDRIELNIQVARESADARDLEGRADYLMKVFRLSPQRTRFEESPLENQVDIERLQMDAKLAADFRQWLLEPANFANFDRGAIVLPDRFLAMSAINETPSRADAEINARKLFSDDDIFAALGKAAASAPLQNILSPAGFARRLDDITCSGCHQTRAIGGFHFPGAERFGPLSDSAVVAAASPHFFGDQQRRRDILAAFSESVPRDFSRGFSARPQQRSATELAGTTYLDGWGAVCYPPGAAAPDKSFSSWSCAEGLSCQSGPGTQASRAGFCFLK